MRDLQFDDMHLFARVAELATLSALARERDVPVSQVSRGLSRAWESRGWRRWWTTRWSGAWAEWFGMPDAKSRTRTR